MVAGCGDDGPTATAPPGDSLTVREYDGERLVRTTELPCDVDDARCPAVIALLPDLTPTPDEVCTQIYGGPERRVIRGTVAGEPVDITVTRADGCQIDRYDRLTAALG